MSVKTHRRTAAPDSLSGQNLNTPILLYDIKPNARFAVGDAVTRLDSRFQKIRGVVLGHVAEDELIIQWPTFIEQVNAEELVRVTDTFDKATDNSPDSAGVLVASRGSRRRADLLEGPMDFLHEDDLFESGNHDDGDAETEELHGELFDSLPQDQCSCEDIDLTESGGEAGVLLDIQPATEIDLLAAPLSSDGFSDLVGRDRTRDVEAAVGGERQALLFGDPAARARRQIVKSGGYQSEHEAYLNYNAFTDQNVRNFLKRYGLHDRELDNYADLRQHQLGRLKQRMEQQANPATGVNTRAVQWGQGTGVNYQVRQPGRAPGGGAPVAPGRPPAAPTRAPAQGQWPANMQQHVVPEKRIWPAGMYPQASASRELTRQALLIDKILKLPHTAARIRQAAEVVQAVRALDRGGRPDATVQRALRVATRDFLAATDHLSTSNHPTARKLAPALEQLYVESLS